MRSADEERIALFLDYENLAIGARENLGGMVFDLRPVADALAERGRVVVRRAYADWLKFGEDGRMLTRHHVELIEIPQRMGSVRKNAADIKMAVDAIELCLERDYITTFVLGTGDSDFTPLVHKLREHNKQVIGLGIQMSTSALLPPACDEFLFYERLEGVELPKRRAIVARGRGRGRRPQVGDVGELGPVLDTEQADQPAAARNHRSGSADPGRVVSSRTMLEAGNVTDPVDIADEVDIPVGDEPTGPVTLSDVEKLLTQTLAGLERASGSVRASSLKRAVLRKSSTFNEADYGFRSFTELLRSLAERGVLELTESASVGDPDVQLPSGEALGEEAAAFELLASVVDRLARDGSGTPLSGLKTQLRRTDPEFSEKRFGFGGFLQFAKAAVTRGVVDMAWNDDADDYLLNPVDGRSGSTPRETAVVGAAPMLQAVPDLAALESPLNGDGAPSDGATGSARPARRRGRRGRGTAMSDAEADAETTPEHLSWAIPAEPAPAAGMTTTGERLPDAGTDDGAVATRSGWMDGFPNAGPTRADTDQDRDRDPSGEDADDAGRASAQVGGTTSGPDAEPPGPATAGTDLAAPDVPGARSKARRTSPSPPDGAAQVAPASQPGADTDADAASAAPTKRVPSPRTRSRAAATAAAVNDAATGDPTESSGTADPPKARRRTTRKATTAVDGDTNPVAQAGSDGGVEEPAPRRRRTRTAAPKAPAGDPT